jgi:hypothetical protein
LPSGSHPSALNLEWPADYYSMRILQSADLRGIIFVFCFIQLRNTGHSHWIKYPPATCATSATLSARTIAEWLQCVE